MNALRSRGPDWDPDILLDGGRIVLLDFDNLAGGDPLLDVANLLFHLAKARPNSPIPYDRRQAAARTFAEEYFAHAPRPGGPGSASITP